jgi:hypothetical protein
MNKNIQTNQHYFKISQENPEKSLDDFYIFDKKNPDLQKYIKNTKEIKHILITIKTLQDKKENLKTINKYYNELQKALGKFSNCSEFICFANACDNALEFVKKDIDLLKEITKRYFQQRILNEIAPKEWIQAILDSKATARKGKCGETKLLSILGKMDFAEVKSWENFLEESKCVAQFSKIFNIKNISKKLNIKIKTKKQGKKLDLIIKFHKKIFLIEAKHLNTSGGGQDKQISELIEIIGLKEKNQNVSYISFLDGNHSNFFISDVKHSEKIKTQRKEIKKYLKKNPQNYWVNTAGFNALFSDLVKSN